MITAKEILQTLNLKPHPIEGGYFRETFRSTESLPSPYPGQGPRAVATAIYYLLTPETFSEMHKLPTEEIYHLYLGGPLRMLQLLPDGGHREVVIGSDLKAGQSPQVIVPAGVWQGSFVEPGADFALVGATMSPGFELDDYEQGTQAELLAQYPAAEALIRRLTRV